MAMMQNRAPWHRSDRSARRGTGLTGRSDRSDWFGPGRPNSAWRGCLSHEEIRRHTILIILYWCSRKTRVKGKIRIFIDRLLTLILHTQVQKYILCKLLGLFESTQKGIGKLLNRIEGKTYLALEWKQMK